MCLFSGLPFAGHVVYRLENYYLPFFRTIISLGLDSGHMSDYSTPHIPAGLCEHARRRGLMYLQLATQDERAGHPSAWKARN